MMSEGAGIKTPAFPTYGLSCSAEIPAKGTPLTLPADSYLGVSQK